jgi:hypothetical protein
MNISDLFFCYFTYETTETNGGHNRRGYWRSKCLVCVVRRKEKGVLDYINTITIATASDG